MRRDKGWSFIVVSNNFILFYPPGVEYLLISRMIIKPGRARFSTVFHKYFYGALFFICLIDNFISLNFYRYKIIDYGISFIANIKTPA